MVYNVGGERWTMVSGWFPKKRKVEKMYHAFKSNTYLKYTFPRNRFLPRYSVFMILFLTFLTQIFDFEYIWNVYFFGHFYHLPITISYITASLYIHISADVFFFCSLLVLSLRWVSWFYYVGCHVLLILCQYSDILYVSCVMIYTVYFSCSLNISLSLSVSVLIIYSLF